MKRVFVLIALVLLLICSVGFAADTGDSPGQGVFVTPKETLHVDYYYGEECSHCKKLEPWLADIAKKYKDFIEIEKHEVFHDKDGYNDFLLKMALFEVPADEQGTPTLIVNKKIFIGGDIIRENFEKEILAAEK